jgi:hypothetical protein
MHRINVLCWLPNHPRRSGRVWCGSLGRHQAPTPSLHAPLPGSRRLELHYVRLKFLTCPWRSPLPKTKRVCRLCHDMVWHGMAWDGSLGPLQNLPTLKVPRFLLVSCMTTSAPSHLDCAPSRWCGQDGTMQCDGAPVIRVTICRDCGGMTVGLGYTSSNNVGRRTWS